VAKRKFTLLLYIAPALDTNDARNRSATGLTFISLVGTVAPGMLEDL
jgi:ABC-type transport system involved in cytochrome c biogenesis permease subunit